MFISSQTHSYSYMELECMYGVPLDNPDCKLWF